MHLVLVGAIAELTALADEERATRAVGGFTIVQSALLSSSKLWIQQEFENEDGLLARNNDAAPEASAAVAVLLPPTSIDSSPLNPRTHFDDQDLQRLADSLQSDGLHGDLVHARQEGRQRSGVRHRPLPAQPSGPCRMRVPAAAGCTRVE
jgi:hypothetical protein